MRNRLWERSVMSCKTYHLHVQIPLCPTQYHPNKSPPLGWFLHPGHVISHCWQRLLVIISSIEIQSGQTGWERNQFLCAEKCLLPGMCGLELVHLPVAQRCPLNIPISWTILSVLMSNVFLCVLLPLVCTSPPPRLSISSEMILQSSVIKMLPLNLHSHFRTRW